MTRTLPVLFISQTPCATASAQMSMSKFESGAFPVNCIDPDSSVRRRNVRGKLGENEAANEKLFNRLHSCHGRPS